MAHTVVHATAPPSGITGAETTVCFSTIEASCFSDASNVAVSEADSSLSACMAISTEEKGEKKENWA